MGYVVDGLVGEYTSLGAALEAAVIPQLPARPPPPGWNWRLNNSKALTGHVGETSLVPAPPAPWTLTEMLVAGAVVVGGIYLLAKWMESSRRPERTEKVVRENLDDPEDE